MARPKITHYVDMLSPFSYTAYHILRHDAVFMECDITHVPVSLVGLMQKCGNTPPIMIKNKDHWTRRERLRWASAFSVPMTVPIPPDFPGPAQLPIMRALCVVSASRQGGGREGQDHGQNQDQDQTHLFHRALDVFFAKQWGPNAVATHNEPGLLQTTLRDLFGAEEAARILIESETTGDQLLTANTDRAFDEGAFGLPWMVCTSTAGETEGFWGVDHLGVVAHFLGLDLCKARNESVGWKSVL